MDREEGMGIRRRVKTSLSGLGFLVLLCNGIDTVQACQSDRDTPVIRKIDTDEKIVALTFDDGPSATFTPQILRLLEQYHVRATFFVIGSRVSKCFPIWSGKNSKTEMKLRIIHTVT
jgi:peptidoglycan/xylan/chitin deacetylase (PgdA/CDA1 family)